MTSELEKLILDLSPANLHVAKQTSRASYPLESSPYKPCLLLLVFHLVKSRARHFEKGWFRPKDCKSQYFQLYRALFPTDKRSERSLLPTFVQPYWYLGASKPQFWSFKAPMGKEADLLEAIETKAQIKTLPKLENLVEYAKLPNATIDLLLNADTYELIIKTIIDNYFPTAIDVNSSLNTIH